MKGLMRITGLLTALVGIMTHVRTTGKSALLTNVHVMATALAPFVTVIGSLLALLGIGKRDTWTTVTSSLGAFISARYIHKVTASHDGFNQTLGDDWLESIPKAHQKQWLPARFTMRPVLASQLAWERDVVIHTQGEDVLLADVWTPPTQVPHSGLGIIYIHSGGWHYMDKDMMTRPFFRYLAHQGHVVVDLAYTKAAKADLRHMVGDVKRAIGWLKTKAITLKIDPHKIVLMGASAGAHLALLSAYTPNFPDLQPVDVTTDTTVAGVISYYGFTDLGQAHNDFPHLKFTALAGENMEFWMKRFRFLPEYGRLVDFEDILSAWLGGTPPDIPDVYRLASPLTHVGPHCPPTLLLNGIYDFGVSVEQHRRLATALQQVDVPVVHVEFPYTNHAFDLFIAGWAPAYQAALYDVERFLAWIAQ